MSRVFSAHAVSVDGYLSGRTKLEDAIAAARAAVSATGVTHLHYEVVR
jgi:hypothetical protein